MPTNIPPKTVSILIADDDPSICSILSRYLSGEGYLVQAAPDGEKALDVLTGTKFELLLSDISMPGMNGIELLKEAKKIQPDMAVLMATGVDDRQTALEALRLGAYGYIIKPFDLNELLIHIVNALERRRLSLESHEYEKRLEQDVRDRTADLRLREEEIALRLVWASEYRDNDTGDHIRRLGLFSEVLAKACGWSQSNVDDIRVAATMHDIGKIGIPDTILLKPGKLTEEEFEVIKKHSEIGAGILSGSELPLLVMARDIALHHHEKWDGSGYPTGLTGENIPEMARIVTVVDVFDAMAYDRIYRPALSEEEILNTMREASEKHFDPRILKTFFEIIPAIRTIKKAVDHC